MHPGVYRGPGFAPVRLVFRHCLTRQPGADGSIRLHAGSTGVSDGRLASWGLWGVSETGVGFDVLVREAGARSWMAHRMTPRDNVLALKSLRPSQQAAQGTAVSDMDVVSRLHSVVVRENITPGVIKTVLLLSAVYG